MAPENVERWKRGVKEKSDFQVGRGFTEHRRQKHELIVMDPNKVVTLCIFQNFIGEQAVDALITFPPRRLVMEIVRQTVKERPNTGIRKTFVIIMNILLAEKNWNTSILL